MAGLTCYADRHCSIIRLLKKAGSATDREALSAGGMSVSVTSQARYASRGRMCYAISRRTVMNHVSQAIQKGRPARPRRAIKDSSPKLARVLYPRDGPDEFPTARVQQESLSFLLLHRQTFSPKGVAGLSFTARIERAQFHRARSASKKDGLAAPCLTLPSVRVARARDADLATPHAPTRLESECRGHSPAD